MDATTLLEKTVARLVSHKSRYAEIARVTGISYSTLTKLAQGHSDNPTISNLQSVIDALDEFERLEAAAAGTPVRIDTPEAAARLLGVSVTGEQPPPPTTPPPDEEPVVEGDSRVVPFEAPP